ncbi:MAG: zinc ribbon domain-containing protein [Blastocatellia bacterium]|nr:zinc ribbon domain-containing protein [Blastocatellia bacterium]
MPIYEYECTNCGNQLEIIQKMSDAPLTDCPKCHRPTLEKLLSQSSFALKGDGWYISDYARKSGSASSTGAETSGSSASSSASEKTTDSSTTADSTTSNSTSESPAKSSAGPQAA